MSGAFRPRSRTIIVLAIIGVPAAVVWVVAQNFTTALWFDEVGHGDVFTRVLFAKTLLAVLAGALTGLFLVVNAWSAISLAPARIATRAYPLAAVGCGLVGASVGWSARQNWQTFLLWVNRQRFGIEDPIHHRDIGFFVFSLPFLEWFATLLVVVAVMGMVVAVAAHWFTGALTFRPFHATRPTRFHLALAGALTLGALAWRLHLETFLAELHQTPAGGSRHFPDRTTPTCTYGSWGSACSPTWRSPARSGLLRRRTWLRAAASDRPAGPQHSRFRSW